MSELDGFEVMPYIDQRTNKGKIASRDKRIEQLENEMREFADCGICKFYHADIQLCEYGIPPCSKFERKAVKR